MKNATVAEKAGRTREEAETLAEELQRVLACDSLSHQIPHSQPLDLVLRVVIAALKNQRNDGRYVASTLKIAIRRLQSELAEDMPDFLGHFEDVCSGIR